MTSIESVTIDVADPVIARSFYAAAFSLDTPLRFLAKDAGVAPEGSGAHRLAIGGDAGSFTDPDGFEWEAVAS